MEAPIVDFWAKLNTTKSGLSWHPLADHCADVGACAEALLRIPTINARLARLGGRRDLDEITVGRLAYLASLHDVGKFNHGFQNKAVPGAQPIAGHTVEVVSLLCNSQDSPERRAFLGALGVNDLTEWFEEEWDLARYLVAAFSHHGRPVQPQVPATTLWRANHLRDPIAGLQELTSKARAWFPAAFAGDSGFLPTAPEFQHVFAGLVMLADWIASDPCLFPFSQAGEGDRIGFARSQAREAMHCIGLETAKALSCLRELFPPLPQLLGVADLRPIQRAAASLPSSGEGGLAVLEVETGSGKTEAALAHFLTLFRDGCVKGMYFALPTRTAATQIYRRVLEVTRRAFPQPQGFPPVVLAVPGYLEVDGVGGTRLAPFEVLWNDGDQERFRFRGWAAEHPKRYLAGAVVVGTIDQILLSTLAVPHAHLRASALLRHLLVIDEVHRSDAYMTRLLREVLKRHLAAGGFALLMSATVGSAARERLLRPGTHPRTVSPPSFAVACATPYPALSHRTSASPPVVEAVASGGAQKTVIVTLAAEIGAPGAVAELAVGAAAAGAAVIVLRKTFHDCVLTQQAVERLVGSKDGHHLLFRCGGVPAPHHARFAKEDREALDTALERVFGKQRQRGGVVAVTTQTVQQSLDIDADLLITDLCPMDVLLQRVGRLHRHPGRPRPKEFATPQVVVLVPAQRDLSTYLRRSGEARGRHGFGTVYGDLRILEATWRLLLERRSFLIPSDNRALVEAATHPERLQGLVEELGGAWHEHGAWVEGILIGDEQQAQLNLIHWESPFLGEDELDRRWLFPSNEMARRIATRLGEQDRLASFSPAVPSPFGFAVRVLTIPAFWLRHPSDGEQAVEVAVNSGVVSFRFGNREFIYDRLGLRPAEPQQEDDDADA